MTRKRHFHLTEEILRENPNICNYKAPSFDARQDMLVHEVLKLGKEAALKAIEEWGQPISNITHLIFRTTSGNLAWTWPVLTINSQSSSALIHL